jgi:hypothetical protein
MNAQDFLTFLFDAIALSFLTIATIDFTTGLMPTPQNLLNFAWSIKSV